MATKLNKTMRGEILENVIRATDIPEQRQDLIRRTKAAAAAIIRDAQPPEFLALIKHAPKEWFVALNSIYVGSLEANPLCILSPGSYSQIYFDDPVTVAQNTAHRTSDFSPLEPLCAEATALVERETTLRREMSAFLLSCATAERLIEQMPELEPHVPTKAKPMPLVAASNVLSALIKSGFDKTVKAETTA